MEGLLIKPVLNGRYPPHCFGGVSSITLRTCAVLVLGGVGWGARLNNTQMHAGRGACTQQSTHQRCAVIHHAPARLCPFRKCTFHSGVAYKYIFFLFLGGRSLACGRASLASDSRRKKKLLELRAPAAATGLVPPRPTRQRQTREADLRPAFTKTQTRATCQDKNINGEKRGTNFI